MRRIVSRLRLAIKHELSASRGRRRVRYENHWVAEGVLHWEEMVEPFEAPVGEFLGHQTIYYTPKGEEWRIRASRLIWQAASKSGGWNEYFKRLEGTLFGYEDWQNDWWIDLGLRGGGFGGLR